MLHERLTTGGRAVDLAARIEGAIRDGSIAAGARLGTKRELCERYNVSYGTLNEAIRVLQHRGFLATLSGPRGGLFAAEPTPRVKLSYLSLGYDPGGTFDECAAVRYALDDAVVVDAAGSRSDADVRALSDLLAELERSASEPTAYLRHNWALHRRIAEACGNSVLRNLYCTLLDANESELRDVQPDPAFAEYVKANLAAHGEIVAAIAAGDAARARVAVARHAASRDRGRE